MIEFAQHLVISTRNGGRLWASINDGPGATFHVSLPSRS